MTRRRVGPTPPAGLAPVRHAVCALLLALLTGCVQTDGLFDPATACDYQMRTSVPLDVGHGRPLVDAEVNGDSVRLIVDTGAETTLLTSAAAQRLGVAGTGTPIRLVGVGGEGTGAATLVHSLVIGELSLRNLPVVVDNDGDSENGPSLGRVADGILGLDVLSHFDVDLDMPNGRITLYRARACENGKPDWTLAYATLDAEVSARLHLIVPIGLDGRTLSATVDSGSDSTVLADRDMARFGLTPSVLRRDPVIRVRGIAPTLSPIRVHRFDALTIGDLLFLHPQIPVSPLPDFVGDMLLGSDVLRDHRAWLSWGSGRVYVAIGK
jgi:predicted aspartyl protease